MPSINDGYILWLEDMYLMLNIEIMLRVLINWYIDMHFMFSWFYSHRWILFFESDLSNYCLWRNCTKWGIPIIRGTPIRRRGLGLIIYKTDGWGIIE